ncbi:MAG: hypothetical protein JNJ83_10960 [Verrucomicrobiaceae bacterium]|nr:hypothetical protein [Verrucomicrobiaceae bacterium]
MQQGDEIKVLTFKEPSVKGLPLARFIIAAAIACGFRLSGKFPVDDYLDGRCGDLNEFAEKLKAGKVERIVRAAFDGTVRASFNVEPCLMDIYEFREKIEDVEWIKANPEHPVAYQGAFLIQLRSVAQALAGKTRIRLERGDREVYLMQGDDEDTRQKNEAFLAMFNQNGA